MHVDRRSDTFNIGEDEIPLVSTYKYLGCVVDEFLFRYGGALGKLGSHALGAWLRRCRKSVGEVS